MDISQLLEAAEKSDSTAQCRLGVLYTDGRDVPRNDELAVKWWRLAAEQGDADAQENLGGMYWQGYGISQSSALAIEWWNKAAKQGNKSAQNRLDKIEGKIPVLPTGFDHTGVLNYIERGTLLGGCLGLPVQFVFSIFNAGLSFGHPVYCLIIAIIFGAGYSIIMNTKWYFALRAAIKHRPIEAANLREQGLIPSYYIAISRRAFIAASTCGILSMIFTIILERSS